MVRRGRDTIERIIFYSWLESTGYSNVNESQCRSNQNEDFNVKLIEVRMKCSRCNADLNQENTKHFIGNNRVCKDCYYVEFGDFIEKNPIEG